MTVVQVMMWGGDGNSWTEHNINFGFGGIRFVITKDIDCDGDLDLIIGDEASSAVYWVENKNGIFTNWSVHTLNYTFDNVWSLDVKDIDGDGDPDIVCAVLGDDEIVWCRNESIHHNATFSARTIIDASCDIAMSIDVGDLDRDGDLDVLGTARDDNSIIWWENTDGSGESFNEITIDSSVSKAWDTKFGDIDGDGDLDVVGSAESGDSISWWENLDGLGTSWSGSLVASGIDGPVGIDIEDINGDGDLDIVCAVINDGDIAWWDNVNGDGSAWSRNNIVGGFIYPTRVHAADVDLDGDIDVLGAGQIADEIAWWENANSIGTSWTKHSVKTGYDTTKSGVAFDIDRDGDMDVVGCAYYGNCAHWWENTNGDATAWSEHIIDVSFEWVSHVEPFDLDADGDIDFLGNGGPGNSRQSGLVWWGEFGWGCCRIHKA